MKVGNCKKDNPAGTKASHWGASKEVESKELGGEVQVAPMVISLPRSHEEQEH